MSWKGNLPIDSNLPGPEEVLAELEKILKSREFQDLGRPCKVLEFLVNNSLRGERVKDSVILATFWPGQQETSRARRAVWAMRGALEKYYDGSGLDDPIHIAIPKGGYKAEFTRRKSSPPRAEELNATEADRSQALVLEPARVEKPHAMDMPEPPLTCAEQPPAPPRQLFAADTVSDRQAAAPAREPEWDRVPAKVQRRLRRRLNAAASRLRLAWVVAVLCGVSTAVLAYIHFNSTPPAEHSTYSSIFFSVNSYPGFLALSPDGRRMAVVLLTDGDTAINVRSLDSPDLRPLFNTRGARDPFWSPDSKSIGFFADGWLKTIRAAGGPVQRLCEAGAGFGGTWSSNGVILFGTEGPGPMMRVTASNGKCAPVVKGESGSRVGLPAFLPHAKRFLYLVDSPDESRRGVYVASLDRPSDSRLLLDAESGVIYAPRLPGSPFSHLLFIREGALWAQPLEVDDDDKVRLAGDSFYVAPQASFSWSPPQLAVSASSNGTLMFLSRLSQPVQLTWLDRAGREHGKVGARYSQSSVALSPDGRTSAAIVDAATGIFVHDLASSSELLLSQDSNSPVWSPDGRQIIYCRGNDLYLRDASGGGSEIPLLKNANLKRPSDWSRDGRFILYTEIDPKTQGDIWYLAAPRGNSGPGRPVRFLSTNAVESQAQLSPDGHWIAYYSSESGRGEIYLRQFPSGQAQWRVSNHGGVEPRWRNDGKEVYYLERGPPIRMMAATVQPGRDGAPEPGEVRKLFQFQGRLILAQFNGFAYSPAADGSFLVNTVTNTAAPMINLITDWQKVATGANEP
jgi:Tol biopolymer transport system component